MTLADPTSASSSSIEFVEISYCADWRSCCIIVGIRSMRWWLSPPLALKSRNYAVTGWIVLKRSRSALMPLELCVRAFYRGGASHGVYNGRKEVNGSKLHARTPICLAVWDSSLGVPDFQGVWIMGFLWVPIIVLYTTSPTEGMHL